MSSAPPLPPRLARSRHLAWFAHMGAVYLFHDLYGYIIEMSEDIADFIAAFGDGVDPLATISDYGNRFGDADPRQFVDALVAHQVLVDPNERELDGIWAFVPIKGKWNVWQRTSAGVDRGEDRVTLWTAWGDRPIQQVMLDREETAMWDAFDGNKRLAELRTHHDPERLLALVRRLVHHDVQALKLSMMPWTTYAKRPGLAPPYLASTMPYPAWQPRTPLPRAPRLDSYHQASIDDADHQFEHRETTLSHLLRVPHPVLAGRSYGQALIDALGARDYLPTAAAIRVLEIGGGLGYLARDAIDRLRERGLAVDYTIVELSPELERAQRDLLGDNARWITGDALVAAVPDHAFDLVIANEVVGDLPALQLTRAAVGLIGDDATADAAHMRVAGGGIAVDLGVAIDDAPDPFYLQTGAFELIARIARWLAPNGAAIVTEFGELAGWPRLSTQLDHPELSTHFGHLAQAARGAGLAAKVEFVIDVLDFDRSLQGLATTRSHFRALRALAKAAGIELSKIGYTPELLARALGNQLDVSTIGELRWQPIEDRLMGLVPHEFKALLMRAPC